MVGKVLKKRDNIVQNLGITGQIIESKIFAKATLHPEQIEKTGVNYF